MRVRVAPTITPSIRNGIAAANGKQTNPQKGQKQFQQIDILPEFFPIISQTDKKANRARLAFFHYLITRTLITPSICFSASTTASDAG
jgi:hypothetical protein